MRVYTAPQLTVRGSLEELTAASVAGTHTDVPLGTPVAGIPAIFS